MKLDATDLRYVTSEDFRVLTAVEMGSKNHEVVPSTLIAQVSGLRNGGVNKILGILAKRNLVARVQNSKYDGYRLTYGGYDYLAMRALSKRDSVYSVGNQIGVGKESDIYIVADAEGHEMVLKLHRLGRVSFRAIKEKRDYMGKRKSASWMYMSRLAAQKEWAFLKVLHEHQFPVPRPIDQARHCILMEFIDAYPLRQIDQVPSPGNLYSQLMDLIVRFAHAGLIHGDFNEFNILIRRSDGKPIVIDFPQMVSTSHENAEWYFNRDVECIRTFFRRRFRYESAIYPRFKSTIGDGSKDDDNFRLDVVVEASGFGRREMRALEQVRPLFVHVCCALMSAVYGVDQGGSARIGGRERRR
ncbi:RIO1-domain-containing protein [Lactifluus subvellereus]|nr:RIO1-domain-containing protein [Lactifluus subvellereus]